MMTIARSARIRTTLIFLCLLVSTSAYARNHYWNYVSRGNVTAVTSLGGSTAKFQGSYPSATVRVDLCGTSTLANIYVSNVGAAKTNPFTASTTGFYDFWTDQTCVKLTFSGGGLPGSITIDNVSVGSSTVPVSVTDMGAACDGVTVDTAAFQASSNLGATAPVTITIPRGTCLIDSTITIANSGVKFVGAGSRVTIIKFAPTSNNLPLFSVIGSSELFRNAISGMQITSADTTNTKIAIRLTDTGQPEIRDVMIGPIGGWTTTSGKTSIGLQIRGREEGVVDNVEIAADKPITIEDNPTISIDNDHWHFSNLNLIADTNPVITVDTGVNLSNLLFDGYQAWNKGTHGFYYNDTTTILTNQMAAFKNVRWEQAQSAGYAIHFVTPSFRNLLIENSFTAAGNNFAKVSGVKQLSFVSNNYPGVLVAADFASCDQVLFFNNFWQASSTFVSTGMTRLYRFGRFTNQPEPGGPFEWWISSSNAAAVNNPIVIGDAFHRSVVGTLVGSLGASVNLLGSSGGQRGRITLTFDGGADGGADYIFTPTAVYKVGGSANAVVGAPAGNEVGVTFVGAGNITLRNNYVATINYTAHVIYFF